MQVPVLSIVFMTLSAVVAIGLPLALCVIFYKKYHAKIVPMVFGAAGFIVSVLILERLVHTAVFAAYDLKQTPLVYITYGVLMAGIFEETARFVLFNILKRKYNGIETGLAYGAGHGGIESILIAGLPVVNAIVFSIIINTGNAGTVTAGLQGDLLEQTNAQIAALVTTPSYSFLVGGLERIFAITAQLSLSVIVFYSVYAKNKLWLYPSAVVLHAILDIPAAAMQAGLMKNIYLVEICTCIGAILVLVIAANIHKKLKQRAAEK
jgi:uncharacterized membrane protein YhfC